MTEQEALLHARRLITECKIQEQATDADEAEALAGNPPSTRGGKCLHACVAEVTGILVDGKLNIKDIVNIAKQLKKDEKTIQNAKKVILECGNMKDTDRCEYSAKAFTCTREAMAKFGIDPSALTQPLD